MSTARDRTRETRPDAAGTTATAGTSGEGVTTDTDLVSAVRGTAPRQEISRPMFEAAGASAPGPDRPVNQDAFGLWPDLGLCVVADGMGGRPAGEVAGRLAVAQVHAFLAESDPERTPPIAWDVSRGLAAGMLARAVGQANQAVHAEGLRQPAWKGMGAALAALLVAGPRIVVAHVGDVRVYRFRGGGLEKLTEDHSQAAVYERWRGEAADPEVLRRQRRVLTQAVGSAPTVRVTVAVERFEPGDVFLVCSDGVWGSLTHDAMAREIAAAPGLHGAAAALVSSALRAGGTDDGTAVLVRPLRGVNRRGSALASSGVSSPRRARASVA